MRRNRILIAAAACALTLGASGCSSYYRIRDTANTDNTYYTKSYKSRKGVLSFKDARTGAKVTMQNSSVQRIPRDEWNGAVDK